MLSEEQIIERTLTTWGHIDAAREIASEHRVSLAALLGRGRTKTVGRARCALYASLRERGLSYPEIGALLNRDHTTVMAGANKTGLRKAAALGVDAAAAEAS